MMKINYDWPDGFGLVKKNPMYQTNFIHTVLLVACIHDACPWNSIRAHQFHYDLTSCLASSGCEKVCECAASTFGFGPVK